MKATDIDWLCDKDATKAWNEFCHLPPLKLLRRASSEVILPPDSPITEGNLRVVTIADTHNWSLKTLKIPNGDILIHAGDFTNKGSVVELEDFNKDLGEIKSHFKVIIVIAGNHDSILQDEPESCSLLTNCVYLQDDSVSVCGINFYGSPWTPKFFNWAFMKPRGEELDSVWRKVPINTDVLITHGAPMGILDLCHSGDRSGCLALTKHVLYRVKPKFHVFGHIHERHGSVTYGESTFINASICTLMGRPINPPIVFDIPLPSGRSKAEMLS